MKKLLLLLTINVFLYSNYARISSMGGLWYIFQDDFNRLNLYDFSKISSALFKDDSTTYVYANLSGFYEKQDSIKYYSAGRNFPELLEETITSDIISLFSEVPFLKTYPSGILYSQRNTEFYSGFGESQPFAFELSADYSYLSKKDNVTDYKEKLNIPSVKFTYSRAYSENLFYGGKLSSFYGKYNGRTSDTVDTNLFPLGVSISGTYMGEIFRTGVDINYNYVMFESEYKDIDFKQRFSGHSVSPVFALILNSSKIKWVNHFSYAWAELKNEKQSKEKTGTNNFSVKTLLFLDFYPFKAFSGFDWILKSPLL